MIIELDLKQKFIELRAKGLSLAKISKEIGKCRQTLSNWNRELEEEIANAKAIELESLFESCLITKEHRIKDLSELLAKVNSEIATRSLVDIPTERLIDLKIRLPEKLHEEYIEPKIKSEDEIKSSKFNKDTLIKLTKI